jgi:predicted porin
MENFMNKKVLAVAIASALVLPVIAQAEVTLSGVIQAEVAGGDEGGSDNNTITTQDNTGANYGSGPNELSIDFNEKLTNGITAWGRYAAGFNTFNNQSLGRQETFIGLKGSSAYVRFGTLAGAYKNSLDNDPFSYTSLQAYGDGGGMTGSRFGHDDYLDNIIEIGLKFGGFSAIFQGVADETESNIDPVTGNSFGYDGDGQPIMQARDGGGILELRYTGRNWNVFLAGAYTDFGLDSLKDSVTDITDEARDRVGDEVEETLDEEYTGERNLKVGGAFCTISCEGGSPGMRLGWQYEDAELGTMDGGKGDLGFLSLDYRVNNVSVGGWVGGYSADREGNDAMSFAVGTKYFFSKRTNAFLGYRRTDSDNNEYDQDVFALGLRHYF